MCNKYCLASGLDLEDGQGVGNDEQCHAAAFMAKVAHLGPATARHVLLHVADGRLTCGSEIALLYLTYLTKSFTDLPL